MDLVYDDKGLAPGVTVITATNRPEYMERLLLNYQRQDYLHKELIIVLNNNYFDIEHLQNRVRPHNDIRLIYLSGKISLGYCYNFAIESAGYDLIAKFDDDDIYLPAYLTESTRHIINTNADIVGKSCRYIYFADLSTLALCCPNPENEFVSYVAGATMIVRKSVFRKMGFQDITFMEDSEFQKECLEAGFNIFSGDRYHYMTVRQPSKQNHTYPINDWEYLSYCRMLNQIPSHLEEYIPVEI